MFLSDDVAPVGHQLGVDFTTPRSVFEGFVRPCCFLDWGDVPPRLAALPLLSTRKVHLKGRHRFVDLLGGCRQLCQRAPRSTAQAPHRTTVPASRGRMTTTPATASDRRSTTYASCWANSSSTNPAEPAATTSRPWLRAPSPPYSPRATRSSPRSWPRCAAPAWGANPHTGPASTATTDESASICKRSSTISPSKRH